MAKQKPPSVSDLEAWRGQAMRDWFAAYALMGMLASPPFVDRFTVDKRTWARIAYEWADAMLAARKPRRTP